MSRLIDTENLDFVSYQGIPDGYKDSFDSGVLYAMNLIDDQPTVDAVPVVRCKNCEYGEIDDPNFPNQYFCHAHGCDWNEGDHFCSNGKEKVKGRS